mgnify:CR=1 FL=1
MSEYSMREALERAREASRQAGFIKEQAMAKRYLYSVDFTISRELVDVKQLDIKTTEDGCSVSIVFEGNAEAKTRVLDAISNLPSVRRSYRMIFEKAKGGDE